MNRMEQEVWNAGMDGAETLLHEVIAQAPDLIFALDLNGRFRFLNDRVEELLGYEKAELTGAHYTGLILSEDLDKAGALFRGLSGSNVRRAPLRFAPKPGARREHPIRLEVAVSRINGTGGVLAPGNFQGFCVIARDVLPDKQPEKNLCLSAVRDPLTGLANRTFFEQRVDAALRKRRRGDNMLAVMFIDLDGFKAVNDSFGHARGDRLLKTVAERLRASLRPVDILARFGGDEFTLCLTDVQNRVGAQEVADRLTRQFENRFVSGSNEVRIGASIGIAIHPGAGDTVETLLDNADRAMYQARRAGRRYQFYTAPKPSFGEQRELPDGRARCR